MCRPRRRSSPKIENQPDIRAHTNPVYVEAYGQLDVNASYNVNDNFSLAVEAINLLDETIRVHGRNEKQTLGVTQTGTRYMIGARYKFN